MSDPTSGGRPRQSCRRCAAGAGPAGGGRRRSSAVRSAGPPPPVVPRCAWWCSSLRIAEKKRLAVPRVAGSRVPRTGPPRRRREPLRRSPGSRRLGVPVLITADRGAAVAAAGAPALSAADGSADRGGTRAASRSSRTAASSKSPPVSSPVRRSCTANRSSWPGSSGSIGASTCSSGPVATADSSGSGWPRACRSARIRSSGPRASPGERGQVLEQRDLGLEKRAGDQLAAQAFVASVTVAAEQNVAEQVGLPDVAMEHQRVRARARECGEGRGQRRLAASGRPLQVGVLLRQQRKGQPRRRVVLTDQRTSQCRPQLDEGGGEGPRLDDPGQVEPWRRNATRQTAFRRRGGDAGGRTDALRPVLRAGADRTSRPTSALLRGACGIPGPAFSLDPADAQPSAAIGGRWRGAHHHLNGEVSAAI